MIEQMKELPAPTVVIPKCDVKYITICGRKNPHGHFSWQLDSHKTLTSAECEAEYCVPGTLRIFEIPTERTNGIES